mgnify:CR=1 FL=1
MKNYINIEKLLLIITIDGVYITFENRKLLQYNEYNTINHAEIIDYYNIADRDCWDVLVFGYKQPFKFNRKYFTKKVLGILLLSNNNHKIVLKLADKGFSKKRFNTQLDIYMKEYLNINKLKFKYITL